MPTIDINGVSVDFPDTLGPEELNAAVKAAAEQMKGAGPSAPPPPQQELKAPTGNEVPISDKEFGGLPRFLAMMKMTPAGVKSALSEMGYETIEDRGKIFVKQGNKFVPLDSPEFNWKDLLDVGAETMGVGASAAPIIATRGAGLLPRLGAAALGGGLSNLTHQGVSSLLPGEDNMTLAERAGALATDVALGGASEGVVSGAAKGVEAVLPRNILARAAAKEPNPAYAAEGRDIVRRTGIPLTPAQITGAPTISWMESLGKRFPGAAEKFAEVARRQAEAAEANLTRVINGVYPDEVGSEVAGRRLKSAYDEAVSRAINERSVTGRMAFDMVKEAGGDQAVIPTKNVVNAVNELLTQYPVRGAGDVAEAQVVQMRKFLDQFVDARGNVWRATPQEMQNLLAYYGKAMAGKGEILKDLSAADQKRVASTVFHALLKDVEEAAAAGGGKGQAAEALLLARDTWREYSQKVNRLSDSTIGALLGVDEIVPEKIVGKLAGMKPSELRSVFTEVEKMNPEVAQIAKRSMLEDAMTKAGVPAADAPRRQAFGGGDVFSAAKFLTALEKSPVWSVMSPAERNEMNIAFRSFERILGSAERSAGNSATAPLGIMTSLLSSAGPSIVAGAKTPLAMWSLNNYGKALLDPQMRREIIRVAHVPPNQRAAATASLFQALQPDPNHQ